MNILHLLRCSAFSSKKVDHCLANLSGEDSLILLDDGCYNLTHPSLANIISSPSTYIVKEHAIARALSIPDHLKTISLLELNDLIFTHNSVVTWQ